MSVYLFDLFFNPKGRLKIDGFCIARLINTGMLILIASSIDATPPEPTTQFIVVAILLLLLSLYSIYIVDSKRLADMGRKRKFAIIGIISMISPTNGNAVLSIIMAFIFLLYLIWLAGTPSVPQLDDKRGKERISITEDLEKTIDNLEDALTTPNMPEDLKEFIEDALKELNNMRTKSERRRPNDK